MCSRIASRGANGTKCLRSGAKKKRVKTFAQAAEGQRGRGLYQSLEGRKKHRLLAHLKKKAGENSLASQYVYNDLVAGGTEGPEKVAEGGKG